MIRLICFLLDSSLLLFQIVHVDGESCLIGSVISKWCFQKILVLVVQIEESKQNTWMG
jgi:hypothetical protein